eukprot:23229-Hanusia_phi.AAC.2
MGRSGRWIFRASFIVCALCHGFLRASGDADQQLYDRFEDMNNVFGLVGESSFVFFLGKNLFFRPNSSTVLKCPASATSSATSPPLSSLPLPLAPFLSSSLDNSLSLFLSLTLSPSPSRSLFLSPSLDTSLFLSPPLPFSLAPFLSPSSVADIQTSTGRTANADKCEQAALQVDDGQEDGGVGD